MAEVFVKIFKRDYVHAATALALIENSMEDYNTVHPHSRLATVHPASTSLHNRNPLCVWKISQTHDLFTRAPGQRWRAVRTAP